VEASPLPPGRCHVVVAFGLQHARGDDLASDVDDYHLGTVVDVVRVDPEPSAQEVDHSYNRRSGAPQRMASFMRW
jgi:hypothetical protein